MLISVTFIIYVFYINLKFSLLTLRNSHGIFVNLFVFISSFLITVTLTLGMSMLPSPNMSETSVVRSQHFVKEEHQVHQRTWDMKG